MQFLANYGATDYTADVYLAIARSLGERKQAQIALLGTDLERCVLSCLAVYSLSLWRTSHRVFFSPESDLMDVDISAPP